MALETSKTSDFESAPFVEDKALLPGLWGRAQTPRSLPKWLLPGPWGRAIGSPVYRGEASRRGWIGRAGEI